MAVSVFRACSAPGRLGDIVASTIWQRDSVSTTHAPTADVAMLHPSIYATLTSTLKGGRGREGGGEREREGEGGRGREGGGICIYILPVLLN